MENINEIILNTGAERAILANCLNNIDTVIDCDALGLSPKHFAIEANKILYNAIMFLFTKNQKVDPISIVNIIKDEKAKKEIDKLGGLEYIMLLQQSPITSNIKMFCDDVISMYVKRSLYKMGEEIKQKALNDTTNDTEQILGTVNTNLTNIVLDSSKIQEAYKMGDRLAIRLQERAESEPKINGIPTGWDRFDKVTGGAESGDLIIVIAESKVGKSATLLNWCKYMCIDLGLPALYVDCEQSEEEQEDRLTSIVSQIPEDEIKTGFFKKDTAYGKAVDKIQRLKEATKTIKDSNFYHISMPEFTLEKIQAIARKFYLKHGIAALFFDYISFNPTLLSQNKGIRDDLILTNLATGLKSIAGDLKIPVITAGQENRAESGNTKKTSKSIGGSLGILQKATKLCFLRNKTEEELIQGKGNQVFSIEYQRHGQSGVEINIDYDRIRLTQKEI